MAFCAVFGTAGFIVWMTTLYYKARYEFLWYSRSKYLNARAATEPIIELNYNI